MILVMCFFTVGSLIDKAVVISLFDRPAEIRLMTSR